MVVLGKCSVATGTRVEPAAMQVIPVVATTFCGGMLF